MAGRKPKPKKGAESPKRGRGRPKGGPTVPFYARIDPELYRVFMEEAARRRWSNRAAIEELIKQQIANPPKGGESK